jgi:hypothetical protein
MQHITHTGELELFNDPDFCALLRLSSRAALSWPKFLTQPLPRNLSPISTWHCLYIMRRCTAIDTGLALEQGVNTWYSVTLELLGLMADITRRCAPGAALYDALFTKDARPILHDLTVKEVVAALSIEGMELDAAILRQIANGHVEAPNAAYRLAYRLLCLLEEPEDYEEQGFCLRLLDRITADLCDGVDAGELELFGAKPCYQTGLTESNGHQKLLARLMDYAEHNCGDAEDYPLLRGMLIADSLRFCRPFGVLTSAVSSVLMRLYYRSRGFELLAMLPLSGQVFRWLGGALKDPEMTCGVSEYLETARYSPDDLSVHQTLNAQMIVGLLDELAGQIKGEQPQKHHAGGSLDDLAMLNNRQRSILSRAARQPSARFHIQYHQTRHRIAYATARRDLLDLVERGYLRLERQGKAFVFCPTAVWLS